LRKPIKGVKGSVCIVKIIPDHGNEVICFRWTVFFRVSKNHVRESGLRKPICGRPCNRNLRFNRDWGNRSAAHSIPIPSLVQMPKLDCSRLWLLIFEEDATEISRNSIEGFIAPPFEVGPKADRIGIRQTLNPAIRYSKGQIGSLVHAIDFARRSRPLIQRQSKCCLQDVSRTRISK